MPAIYLLLSGISSFLAETFGRYLSRKLSKLAGALIVLGALFAAAYASLNVLLGALSIQFPAQYSSLLAAFLPDNTMFCISTVVSARFIKAAFDWKARLASISMQGS
ncbi:DUF5455 family protein [Pseudomonas trivialis]|uniref:DUF5455 family protein n=1 Tax=Pseudomonas trivialis TaxID=200450 RepID=UPI0009E3CFAA|nr:DUF5455 family protein [Pseudomonas trivialis]